MNTVSISSSESLVSLDQSDSNIDFCSSDVSACATSEPPSCTSENRLSYEALQKRLTAIERVLDDTQKKNEQLEPEKGRESKGPRF